jgi:hypothetical protein
MPQLGGYINTSLPLRFRIYPATRGQSGVSTQEKHIKPYRPSEAMLRKRYGTLLTVKDVAAELDYPTPDAVRKAHARGRLPIPLKRVPPRRGWFAEPHEVALYFRRLDEGADGSGGER